MAQWGAAFKGYDPLLAGSMSVTTNWSNAQWKTRGEKVLLRMINMGFETQPMHIHGYHLKVLGSDQRPWPWANRVLWGRPTPFNQGMEKNTVLIGSGETYELLLDFGQQDSFSTYPTGTQTRYEPSDNTPRSNTSITHPAIPHAGVVGDPSYIAGPTVTGAVVPLPDGSVAALDPTGTQIFPFHNHDDYKATNNGAYPGGQFTAVIPLP
jgi:FtsP/CotA-like multicopper oxidase with cupredoxin domain